MTERQVTWDVMLFQHSVLHSSNHTQEATGDLRSHFTKQRVIISQSVLAYKQSGKSQAKPDQRVETPNHTVCQSLQKVGLLLSTVQKTDQRMKNNVFVCLFYTEKKMVSDKL